MHPDDAGLLVLAEAVADGSDVDWNSAESGAESPDDRHVVQQLRMLAEVRNAARARAALWGPLEMRGEVGRGTFGTVHRAWDTRLEREVALKLLNTDGASATLTSTVIKEGRLLARIRHPNVVTVYGADTFDGSVGIWMEFVSGKTLKDIVQDQGPFGAHEAAIIGRDLCRALAAVHARGFLHRDVKAQNVMREAGGRTVLMDFGAGEAMRPVGEPMALTGTPVYLAPELLAGEPPSARSDVYSLGVLMYFLASGGFPVTGTSLDEIRDRHARGHRTPLRDLRPDLPPEFIRVVEAASAASPADRPDSAGRLEALLETALGLRTDDRRSGVPHPDGAGASGHAGSFVRKHGVLTIAVLALVSAVSVGAGTSWWRKHSSTARNSVAILPFRNLTGSDQNNYLSEGITADLIANLTALPDLRVIAGASMRHYTDVRKSVMEVGAELGVATVLEAVLRRSGDQLSIVAQLSDARTGEQLWAQPFTSSVADVTEMKSDVASKLAVALKGELTQREMEQLRPGKAYDAAAFNLYLKGRYYAGLRTPAEIDTSIQYFQDALARDSTFAPAYAGLAAARIVQGTYGMLPREEAFGKAAAAAERAVALDDSLAEAHASLGYARKNRFEWAAAEASFKRAIDLKPGYATAHHWYSILLTQQRRFPAATSEIRLAISQDPLSIGPKMQFASLLTMSRRYDAAIAQYGEVLRMDGSFVPAYRHLAKAYLHNHQLDKAMAMFDEASRKSPIGSEDQELKADIGYLHAVAGRVPEALAIAAQLTERYQQAGEQVAGSIAAIYAGLQRVDPAIEWLTRARDSRDPEIGYLKVDPRWEMLHRDPRFGDLLASLGFER